MFSLTDYIKHQLHFHFKICKRQNKMTSRIAHFVWSHIVCFSYETPVGRFNFEFVQTYSNYMTSIWLVCLISRAPLAGTLQNIQRELHQHSWEHFKRARCIDPACPLSWVCDHSILSCTNKTRSFNQYAENMVSTLKHRIITEKITKDPQKWQ